MNSDISHLTESASKLLELSDTERIERIRAPRWIGYPRAKAVLDKLEDLLVYPKTYRMPNLLIVGETNNGKTMLVQRFQSKHPARDNPQGNGIIADVMLVQAPPVPDEGRFYSSILNMLFAPYRPSDRVEKKQFQAIQLMRYINLRMLVIDEIHHILAGNLNKQRAFLNVMKYLSNELQIPIVGVGTKDAFRALQTDPQLANRFEPVVLPRWKFDDDFLRLLKSFEMMIPLKKQSCLCDSETATVIFSMTEGYIGEVSRLLTEAAVLAVKNGCERIDAKTLKETAWVNPSERKRQAERL
jgi:type II secretory pathway predicted ATPase ExeA